MRILLALTLLIGPYLSGAFESTGFPGMSVVITDGDTVVRADGFGHDSHGDPVTADTPMRVASVSKSFTAAAVLTLVDEGRVALDQPVATYVPEFRMADPRAAEITVRQLLHQTSGLSDRTVDIAATQRTATLSEYVTALREGHLAADPGTRGEYTNVNYDVAARVVEAVDGRPFPEAMRARVFEPLGMTRSSVGGAAGEGYVSVFGVWVQRPELNDFPAGGAGDVVTTAADMGRWLRSQTGHGPQIVSPDSLRTMHTPSEASDDYGMGWGVEHVGGRTLLVHSGNLFTYTAVEAIDPATGDGWAVMTNSASMADETYDVLLGLVALDDGRTPDQPGGNRTQIELIFAGVGLLALALGVAGVLRARRWAARRAGRARWWTALRLMPALIPAVLLATCPQWVSVLINGRAVTWAQMTYFPAPLTITVAVAGLAGLAVAVARLRATVGSAR